MSFATEIKRYKNAKSVLKTNIEEKGVEVGEGRIDTYAEKISEISSEKCYESGYEAGKKVCT